MHNILLYCRYWPSRPRLILAWAGLLMGLTSMATLALFSRYVSAAEKESIRRCGITTAVSVSQTGFAKDGDLVVRLSDGTIRKYSRNGRMLWEAPLMEPSEGVPFQPYSFDFDGPDIVLVGVSPIPGKRPVAALYRLEGETPTVRRVRILPPWAPGGITVAPDGTLFVVALSARKVNGVLAAKAPGITVTDYSIHQLDGTGNVLRSLAAVTYSTDSVLKLAEQMAGAKVVFSPSGRAYFFSRSEPVLRRLNLDTGELEGYVSLPFAGFAETVNVPNLEFVSESEVAYSLFQTQGDRILGAQIRTLNLNTGESEPLSSTGPDRMMDYGQYDPVSGSIQALSLRFDQPFGQSTFQMRRLNRSSERGYR